MTISATSIEFSAAEDYRLQARQLLNHGPALPLPTARYLILKARTLGGTYRRGSKGMTVKEFQAVYRELVIVCDVLAATYGMTSDFWRCAVVSLLQEIDTLSAAERKTAIDYHIELACSEPA